MYSLKWVRTMENCMEARVSAVITTFKTFYLNSTLKEAFLFKKNKRDFSKATMLPLIATVSNLCPTQLQTENNAAVS